MSGGAISAVGRLLKRMRAQRGLSQLRLSLRADLSSRHLAFVETGRAKPSRDTVVRLANALDVPLVERNALLVAAGFAPIHPTSALDSEALARVRSILERLLRATEPYPALAAQRDGRIVAANVGFFRLLRFLGVPAPADLNLFVAAFEPTGLRRHLRDWERLAGVMLRRLRREADALGGDEAILGLIARLERYPGVPSDWQCSGSPAEVLPCLTFTMERDGRALSWVSTITMFGTPQDVTVQGLGLESFFPADEETERDWLAISAAGAAPR